MEHFKKLEEIMKEVVKHNKVEEFYKNYYKLPSYRDLISKPEYLVLMSTKYELAYKMTIKETDLSEIIEIIPCTSKAQENILGVKLWEK